MGSKYSKDKWGFIVNEQDGGCHWMEKYYETSRVGGFLLKTGRQVKGIDTKGRR